MMMKLAAAVLTLIRSAFRLLPRTIAAAAHQQQMQQHRQQLGLDQSRTHEGMVVAERSGSWRMAARRWTW